MPVYLRALEAARQQGVYMSSSRISEVAAQVLEEHETNSTRLVNRVRYVIVLMITGPLILTSLQSTNRMALLVNLGGMAIYLLLTAAHTVTIRRGQIVAIRRFNWVALGADVALLFGVMLYWGLALAPGDFTFMAKTPVWFLVALTIASTALQFDRRAPIAAIGMSLLAYGSVLVVMFHQGVETTGNWVEYVNGGKIDLGDIVFTKPVVFTLTGLIAAYTIRRSMNMVGQITTAESKRALLSRYFSPAVVEDITEGGGDLTRGRRQKVTILFLDIRNFTRMSESLDPDVLIDWLSDFRGRLTSIVFHHGGSVDKFIGDAIMATFGTPRPAPGEGQDSTSAVRCALAMLAACNDLDRRWSMHGIQNRIGIGIHSGDVFAGNVGDSDQIEYTVIGDPVNTASRIESLCKKLERPLIVSSAVRNELLGEFDIERLPRVRVKGKEEPLELFAVRG